MITSQPFAVIAITIIAFAGLIAFPIVMFKNKRNAKISKKTKSQGEVVAHSEHPDQYAEIIDHYPTYNRQVK